MAEDIAITLLEAANQQSPSVLTNAGQVDMSCIAVISILGANVDWLLPHLLEHKEGHAVNYSCDRITDELPELIKACLEAGAVEPTAKIKLKWY